MSVIRIWASLNICYLLSALLARWSSGQDGGLSRRKQEFDSPTGHHKLLTSGLIYCNMLFVVGVVYGEGPPVPIPNTEVKLTCADDTWLATAW